MNKAILVSGSLGQERLNYIDNYLKDFFNKDSSLITIYDSTYGFIKYSHYDNCKYFSVDSTIAFINYLKTIKDRINTSKLTLVFEAYAGLFYSKENLALIEDILKNKDNYNLDILISSRHIDFIPESFIQYFNERVVFDEVVTLLANTK